MEIGARSSRTSFARGIASGDVDTEPPGSAGHWQVGRAYRAGRLVCGCVHVAIRFDDRLGLTRGERRMVRLRFCEPVDDDLRAELTELAQRRGRASERAAERIAPIELVIDETQGERERMTGRLRPPHRRHARLREIEFGLRERTG
jgi:hypothetical protein